MDGPTHSAPNDLISKLRFEQRELEELFNSIVESLEDIASENTTLTQQLADRDTQITSMTEAYVELQGYCQGILQGCRQYHHDVKGLEAIRADYMTRFNEMAVLKGHCDRLERYIRNHQLNGPNNTAPVISGDPLPSPPLVFDGIFQPSYIPPNNPPVDHPPPQLRSPFQETKLPSLRSSSDSGPVYVNSSYISEGPAPTQTPLDKNKNKNISQPESKGIIRGGPHVDASFARFQANLTQANKAEKKVLPHLRGLQSKVATSSSLDEKLINYDPEGASTASTEVPAPGFTTGAVQALLEQTNELPPSIHTINATLETLPAKVKAGEDITPILKALVAQFKTPPPATPASPINTKAKEADSLPASMAEVSKRVSEFNKKLASAKNEDEIVRDFVNSYETNLVGFQSKYSKHDASPISTLPSPQVPTGTHQLGALLDHNTRSMILNDTLDSRGEYVELDLEWKSVMKAGKVVYVL